ncbi:MAG: hypothetical protein RR212_03105 [Bacteroidales bacterium]
MKTKNYLKSLIALSMVSLISFSSCSSDSDNQPEVLAEGVIGNGDQEFIIKRDTVFKKGTYELFGWVYVTEGTSVTFEPGCVIKGDKATKAALIVEKGGKLIARGTASEPIVFTSSMAPGNRRPGDWGGLILCGEGLNNKGTQIIEGGPRSTHGGTKADDNSGVLSYVRVEFAGIPFAPDQEINGITFGSVGSGTTVDHVQVSYSGDDSFEWFGGSVNCKYLVAYHGWDDEFDTDNGYNGNLQFLLSVKNPRIADTSCSNGFESDNNSTAGTENPFTSPVFSNVTFVGPIGQDEAFVNDASYITAGNINPDNGAKLGIFQAAMQIRRNSKLNCFNSVAMGYPVGIMLENDKGGKVQTWASNGDLSLKNNVFAGMTILGSDKNKSFKDQLSTDASNLDETQSSFSSTFFLAQGNKNLNAIADLNLKQPNSLKSNANYGPMAGSPLLNAASFEDARLSGFDRVSYVGAFANENDNWMAGWTNFDPQNTVY